MPKRLILLENDMYVRNFVASGAFDQLLADPDCFVASGDAVHQLLQSVLLPKLRPGQYVGEYQRHSGNIALTYQANVLSMTVLSGQSATFRHKLAQGLYPSAHARWYRWLARAYRLGWTQPYAHARQKLLAQFQPNASLQDIIARVQPHQVIFPVTGVEATGTELTLLKARYGFKTMFLVNGWDNLSSKGVFLAKPDRLGVWGPQAQQHAVTLQGMAPHCVDVVGCARYESYRLFSTHETPPETPPVKTPYIVFAGATTACDELTPLKQLDTALAQSPFSHWTILYRPHPWREPRSKKINDVFQAQDYQCTRLDPQVADNYYREKAQKTEDVSSENYPALDYYAQLLRHAQFVVSPMSSMTLEAALFNVPTLIVAYNDGIHRMPAHLQAEYAHFEGGRSVPGWVFEESLEALPQTFLTLCHQLAQDTPQQRHYAPQLAQAMQTYVAFDPAVGYAQRLEQALLKLDDRKLPV